MAGLKFPKRVVRVPKVPAGVGFQVWYKQGYGLKKPVLLPGLFVDPGQANSLVFYRLEKRVVPAGIHYMLPVGATPDDPGPRCWIHFG